MTGVGYRGLLGLALTAALGLSARGLTTTYEVEDFFPTDTPERIAFDRYQEAFGRDDRAALVIVERSTPFDAPGFLALEALGKAIAELPAVETVQSATATSFPIRDDAGRVRLVRGADLPGADLVKRLKQPPWVGNLLSADGTVAVIVARLRPSHMSSGKRAEFLGALEDLTSAEGIQLAGYPVHRVMISRYVAEESRRLVPWVLVVMGLLLMVLLGGVRAALVPLITAVLTVVWTLGLMAALGVPTNILAPALFILILVVSVGDSVHLVARHAELGDAEAATRDLLKPIALTSATSAAVFGSLALTGVPMIAALGQGVALGVLSGLCVTLLVGPALLAVLRPPVRDGWLPKLLMRLDRWVAVRPGAVVLGVAALGVGLLLLGLRVEVNSPLLADLPDDHPSVLTNRLLEERMGGVIPLDLLVPRPLGPAALAYSPERMGAVDRLTQRLRGMPGVLNATSATDAIRTLSPALRGVPDAEILGLIPTGLLLAPDVMREWVDDSRHLQRIRLRIGNLNTRETLALVDRVATAYEEELGESATGRVTGQGVLGQLVNHRIVDHFSHGFVVGTGLVLLILLLAFRTFKLAIASLLPNLLPIAAVLGVMGLCGIDLRYTSALVLAVVFGLAVDDTIHMLAQVRNRRGAHDPVGSAMRSAGPGVAVTSLVFGGGLGVLLFSDFEPNRTLGLLLIVCAVSAIIGDLVLLPAILRLWARRPGALLEPSNVAVQYLAPETVDDMYRLFAAYYDNTDPVRFRTDLQKKQRVILLREPGTGAIRGFSTVRVYGPDEIGARCQVIYSGDTVVDSAWWGGKGLQLGFIRTVLRLRLQRPQLPTYWLLTTKGYKTYLLMTNYFGSSWPRYDATPTVAMRALMNRLGAACFGEAYDAGAGVVTHGGARDRVKEGVADLTDRDLESPHIRYFAEQNPGFTDGDELLCLAKMQWWDPPIIILGIVLKRWMSQVRGRGASRSSRTASTGESA